MVPAVAFVRLNRVPLPPVPARENDGLYGTDVLFEEPNPTGSRPRDLIGLYRQQKKTDPPNTQGRARREHGGVMMMMMMMFITIFAGD